MCLFFFSSRRRHTRWNCDWSSDVCSSDLETEAVLGDAGSEVSERGAHRGPEILRRGPVRESGRCSQRKRDEDRNGEHGRCATRHSGRPCNCAILSSSPFHVVPLLACGSAALIAQRWKAPGGPFLSVVGRLHGCRTVAAATQAHPTKIVYSRTAVQQRRRS